jgi:anti-sigma regulatory factor (Ser/Thr protein kinase)
LELQRTIPNGPFAPAAARGMVTEFASELPEDILNRVRLVASEIVSNSFKHAGNPHGAPIEMTLTLTQGHLRLEVDDHSIFDPTPETVLERDDVRWGLTIVERTASDCGRISEGSGIWAEFDLATGSGEAEIPPL